MTTLRPAILLATLLLSCAPTGGSEVSFSMRLETAWPTPATPGTFTTTTGWTVTLDDAWLVAGPIYLHEKPPVGLALRQRSLLETGWNWLVPVAHAHPGDVQFAGGTVFGEFVEQRLFDVRGPPVTVEGLTGTAARVRSFTVVLYPARDGLVQGDDPVGGAQVVVAGTAVKDEATVRFEGALSIADEGRLRYVEGIPADATLADGGTFVVEVKPRSWFDRADFSTLTVAKPGGAFDIDRNSQVWGAWFIGARSAEAWASRWEPAP